jgi:hypothetical protein
MELEKAKEFCERWLPAWTGNRPEYLISFYSDDAYYSDPYITQGIKGKEQLTGYLRKLISIYPDWKYEYVEIFPTKNGFTLKWKLSILINNETITDYGLDIVEISNDKIIRNEVYFDTGRMMKAIKRKQS